MPKTVKFYFNSNTNFGSYLKNPVSENFVFANITYELIIETTNMIKLLKNAINDNISTHLLKKLIECIA